MSMDAAAGVERSADRPPRVLILVENADIPFDRRVTEEARSLSAAGRTVSIICPKMSDQPLKDSLDGITIRRFRPLMARGGALSQAAEYLTALAKTFVLMLAMLRRPGFDVVHACNPPDLYWLIMWPFKLIGKRFVFDQHDLSPELYSALYARDDGLILGLLRWAERLSYRAADAVIVPNESYRGIALSRGRLRPERVFVVRNGPKNGWPVAGQADPSLRRGRRYLVVYMGVMGFQDGVDVLLQAVDLLVHRKGFHDATFALLGEGNAKESLRARAAELGIEEFVEFAGWVKDGELMSAYLATADACVSPEPSSPLNDHSTFIKVMEYMAAGTPVIAFDLPETRASAGEAAVYSEPGDIEGFANQIVQVLGDEGLSSRMRSAAHSRIESLRWEGQVPSLLAAYATAEAGLRTGR